METIGEAARRLLAGLERAANAKERPSGERPERIEPEAISREDSDQRSGIRREGATDGEMNCGQPGFRVQSPSSSFERENETDCPSPEASLTADRNDREGSMLRVIGCNDNRAHAAGTFWRWS